MRERHERDPHGTYLECTCGKWVIKRQYVWDDQSIARHEQHRFEMAMAEAARASKRDFVEAWFGSLDGAE